MQDQTNEKQFGKGANRDRRDSRDHLFGGMAPFDFVMGFDIEMLLGYRLICNSEAAFFGSRGREGWGIERYLEIKKICEENRIKPFLLQPNNQGQSSSCTAQAVSKYLSVLNMIETGIWVDISPRDIYAYTNLGQNQGGMIRDAIKRGVDPGVATEALVPSYHTVKTDHGDVLNPMTESEYRTKPEETESIKAIRRTLKSKDYRTISLNGLKIDQIAWMVLQGFGCVFGVDGENNGTWMSTIPQPPTKEEWGHAIYVPKIRMEGEKKAVVILNSWGNGCGKNGWQALTTDYINASINGNPVVFNPWTLIDEPNQEPMPKNPNVRIVKDANGPGVGILIFAKSPEEFKSYASLLGAGEIPTDANGILFDQIIEGTVTFTK